MSRLISSLFTAVASAVGAPFAVLLISFLPLAEARLSLPLALSFGLSPLLSALLSFIGSSLPSFLFLPLLHKLFETEKASVKASLTSAYKKKLTRIKKRSTKRSGSNGLSEFNPNSRATLALLGGFVALPLPMTGVWSGIIIGALLGSSPLKAALSVTAGNFVACCLILVFSIFLAPYVNIIVTILTLVAIIAAFVTLVKVLMHLGRRK